MSKINAEVYTDIGVIIDMMPESLRNKLSKEFIDFININKDNNYISNINSKVPLNKQVVRKETKELMAIIYREYLCSSSKKEELLEQDEEFLRSEEESKIGFDPKIIFVNKQDEENALTVKKDIGYITRIINKIKRMLQK